MCVYVKLRWCLAGAHYYLLYNCINSIGVRAPNCELAARDQAVLRTQSYVYICAHRWLTRTLTAIPYAGNDVVCVCVARSSFHTTVQRFHASRTSSASSVEWNESLRAVGSSIKSARRRIFIAFVVATAAVCFYRLRSRIARYSTRDPRASFAHRTRVGHRRRRHFLADGVVTSE